MKTINDYIQNAFKDIDVSEEEKRAAYGIYTVSFYKACLEILIGLKGSNLEFIRNLNAFLDGQTNSLPVEEKEFLDEALEREKGRIITTMFSSLRNNLADEEKKKLDDNLGTIATPAA